MYGLVAFSFNRAKLVAMSDQHDTRLRVTLDHNCLIALEKDEPEAKAIKLLIPHHKKTILLGVPAISASEWQLGDKRISTFSEFNERILVLGVRGVEILRPLGYWDVCFWDWAIWGSEEDFELEKRIHRVLFPNIPFDYPEYCESRDITPNDQEMGRVWLNRKCDVLSMWSHIYYKGSVFVTSDRNYHKKSKKPALVKLGAGTILTPREAVSMLDQQ